MALRAPIGDEWVQCSGDANPVDYGGVFWRRADNDPDSVELVILQPAQEHCNRYDAPEHPFWVQTLYVDRSDVDELLKNKDWRQGCDVDSWECPTSADGLALHELAEIAAEGASYGALGKDAEGNLSGQAIVQRWLLCVKGSDGSLDEELLAADVDYAGWRAE